MLWPTTTSFRPLRWWRDAWRWCRGRAEGCFSVDEQAASVTALVAAEAAACAASGRKLVVVGHSIGGYLALRALKASGADGVRRADVGGDASRGGGELGRGDKGGDGDGGRF